MPSFAQALQDHASECQHFAVHFYAWYVPLTQKNLNEPAFHVAIRQRASMFVPPLLRALKADAKAQSHANGDLVGIDFDPFVGGQDPADHYDVRNVRLKGGTCFAELWRNSPTPAKPMLPDAIAELSQAGGRWQFENFRYPEEKADLVSVLAALRSERGEK
jgi:hypothetical protein